MKTATKMIAQGDVLFVRVASVPTNAVKRKRSGPVVVAHSETGHHHSITDKAVTAFDVPGDSLTCYLRLDDGLGDLGGVAVEHHRPWDTHETVALLGAPGDVWQVRRQREWSPEGWRRVQD